MAKPVIGLVGPIASGKGLVAKYLHGLGFAVYSLSDRVREEAQIFGITPNRENLQAIGNLLRDKYGGQILAERTLSIIKSEDAPFVIDSIRNPDEILYLRQFLPIKILGVTASVECRLRRYLDRAMTRDEDPQTVEDFTISDRKDLGIGEGDRGQQVGRCLFLSDYIIENEDTSKHLMEATDYFLISELGFSPEGARRSKEK